MVPVNRKFKTMIEVRLPPVCLAGNNAVEYSNDSGSMSRRLTIFDFPFKVANPDPGFKQRLERDLPRILWKVNLAYIMTVTHTRGAFPEDWKPYFEDTYSKHAAIAMDKEAIQSVESGDLELAEEDRMLQVYCPLKFILARFKGKKKQTVRAYLLRERLRITMSLPYPRLRGSSVRSMSSEFIFGIDVRGSGDPDFELSAGLSAELRGKLPLVFDFWPRLASKLDVSSPDALTADPIPDSVWRKYLPLEELVDIWNLQLLPGQDSKRVSAITIGRHPVMKSYPTVFATLPDAEGRAVTGNYVFGIRLASRQLRQPDLSADLIEYVKEEYEVISSAR
jgi:hypothetical protein